MITSALLRTETERWREELHLLSSSGVLKVGFLAVLAWHDRSFLGQGISERGDSLVDFQLPEACHQMPGRLAFGSPNSGVSRARSQGGLTLGPERG